MTLKSKDETIAELKSAIKSRDETIAELNNMLQSMQQSAVWQLLMKYHQGFVERVILKGKRRSRIYHVGIISLRIIVNEGYKDFSTHYKRYINAADNPKTTLIYSTKDNDGLNKYRNELLIRNSEISEEYVPLSASSNNSSTFDIKTIAFYLPQFHPIPENDEWWGKGFTEWTNVSRGYPQFRGHYQPHLPAELGFYDLRLADVQKRQVELAKQYGIHGFCFYYYWFNGKKLLDMPLDQFVQNSEIDFPFCICWANENWTRTWDGLDDELLMEQKHSEKDDLMFIEEVSKLFKDPGYIKINGKPLLIIYRTNLFPKPSETAKRWREYCKTNGIGDIYLATTCSFEHIDPSEIGFDAAIEFAPNSFGLKLETINHDMKFFNDEYQGQVYDYKDLMDNSKAHKKPDYNYHRSICPDWDNTARKPDKGILLHKSSPDSYKKWLEYLCYYTDEHFVNDEKLIFVNAWNEWAEGAHLEPDRRFGYAYLQATRDVLEQFESTKKELIMSTQHYKKDQPIAVILHLYYLDQWPEIKKYLSNLKDGFDLYISINANCTKDYIKNVLNDHPDAHLFIFENRGRDVLPFYKIFNCVYDLGYDYICKIHTKKSLHRIDGNVWRKELFEGLLGSEDKIKEMLNIFDTDQSVGMLVPAKHLLKYQEWSGSNEKKLEQLCHEMGINYTCDFVFPGGSMFWFKPECFKELTNLQKSQDFNFDYGQVDGTLAHVFERFFGLIAISEGYTIHAIE